MKNVMIKEMRQETVEEFLKRGGAIEKIPQVLDTVGSWWGFHNRSDTSQQEDSKQVVPWKSIQPDSRMDSEDDDKKYWTQLNRKLDKLIKKMKKEGKIT